MLLYSIQEFQSAKCKVLNLKYCNTLIDCVSLRSEVRNSCISEYRNLNRKRMSFIFWIQKRWSYQFSGNVFHVVACLFFSILCREYSNTFFYKVFIIKLFKNVFAFAGFNLHCFLYASEYLLNALFWWIFFQHFTYPHHQYTKQIWT